MKGPEMANVLRKIGFENIKSHMAVLDSADQMMVIARLEAQGMSRMAAPEPKAEPPATPRKKSLTGDPMPRKKSLPPPITQKKPGKPLPTELDEVEVLVAGTEDGATTALVEPEAATELQTAATDLQTAATELQTAATELETAAADLETSAAEPETAAVTEPEPAVAEPEAPEPPPVAETLPTVEAEAAEVGPAEAPALQEAVTPEPEPVQAAAAMREPATEKPSTAPKPPQIKRLLVPKAKAQVVGRIDLPQETIRDATRRSAPSTGPGGAADQRLRRTALEKTQSRTATRSARGLRRGPGHGPRGGGRMGRRPRSSTTSTAPTIDPNKIIEIEPPISVKALSEALGVKINELIATLTFKLGIKGKTINSFVTPEEVELVGLGLERNIKIVERKEAEEELLEQIVELASQAGESVRSPVVTFMGHVDHGKTSLLDNLRNSRVTSGEAGGITQHVGAYKITNDKGQSLVILDTPGHAAFTAMRARGASVTDIVVLVVAADDGVMPQTEEAINHAKDAGVPIVVAINKCDTAGANPLQVRQQLAVKEVQHEDWGGSTQMVEVSAVTGQGLEELVEKIILEGEILELKARPDTAGKAVVIESKQTPEQGVVVNILVTDGTMRVKDQVLCGESFSRIRGMVDDHGQKVLEAGPATPITVLGLDKLPHPGEKLFVVTDTKKAKEVVEDRQRRARDVSLAERSAVTLDTLSAALAKKQVQEVKVILKADVMGSLEPIKKCLGELATKEVRVNFVHSALGGITETDVSLAEASGAIIIGFNTAPDQSARIAAERSGVEIRMYDVIYELIDQMKLALEGLLAPEELESIAGHAEVRAVFKSSKAGRIAGCYVTEGVITRNGRARLSRDGRLVQTTSISSLRREKDDVKEVRAGFECGLTLANFEDIQEGDQLEIFTIEFIKRKLD
jgi:translation initiation factor IF-2